MIDKKRFEMKEEHLKLLRNMYVGWDDCEFGAPEIDPKRPYGNSDVLQDMLRILGVLEEVKQGGQVFKFVLFGKEYLLKGEDKFNIDLENEEEFTDILNKLHRETQTALQIMLVVGKFEIGIYEANVYSNDWEKLINNEVKD